MTTTETRATLYIPPDSPETSMSLGKEWSGTDWNSAGFCVNTDGRVWIDACGDSASTSSFSCFSKGGAGVGQLLAQSLQSNLYVFSKESTVVSANDSMMFAGAKGLKVVAGHGIMEEIAGTMIDIEVGGTSLERVAPDDEDPSSDHAASYVSAMETVEKWWSVCDLSLSGVMILSEALRQIMGIRGVGSALNTATAVTGLAALSRVAGGATSMGRADTDEVGALNLNALGSINLTSTGFTSIYAGAGVTVAGMQTGGVGMVEAALIGGLSASLKSTKEVKVDGRTVEITARKDISFGSTTYKQKSYGQSIQIGAMGGEYLTQLPTQTVTLEALDTIDCHSFGDFALAAGDTVEMQSREIFLSGAASAQITGPGYEISIGAAGVKIAVAGTTQIKMGPTETSASVGAGAMALKLSPTGARIGGNASLFSVSAQGVWQMKGIAFTYL